MLPSFKCPIGAEGRIAKPVFHFFARFGGRRCDCHRRIPHPRDANTERVVPPGISRKVVKEVSPRLELTHSPSLRFLLQARKREAFPRQQRLFRSQRAAASPSPLVSLPLQQFSQEEYKHHGRSLARSEKVRLFPPSSSPAAFLPVTESLRHALDRPRNLCRCHGSLPRKLRRTPTRASASRAYWGGVWSVDRPRAATDFQAQAPSTRREDGEMTNCTPVSNSNQLLTRRSRSERDDSRSRDSRTILHSLPSSVDSVLFGSSGRGAGD